MHIQYLEIVTPDVDAACGLYAKVHGIAFSGPDPNLGNARTAKLANGGMLGIRAPMHAGERPVVRPYILVEDIEAAVAAAAAAGGDIIVPPMNPAVPSSFATELNQGSGSGDHGSYRAWCVLHGETAMTELSDQCTETSLRSRSMYLAAAMAVVTLVLLGLLHLVSPEFDPSWRMVSEYANGRFGWVLALMFVSWAVSTWALAFTLYPLASTWPARLGIGMLVIAGIGEAMAAAFDINHPLHMHAAILGMNGLPIAALLIGISFARAGHWGASRRMMLWMSQLPWISVVVMSIAMALFFTGLSRAGIVITPNSKPLATLPAGVLAIGGWANRFLILSYCIWAIAAAWCLRTRLNRETATEKVSA